MTDRASSHRRACARNSMIVLALTAITAGCSNRAWYEGFRGSAQHDCVKTQEDCPPGPEYEQYKQQREDLKKDNK